MDTTQVLPLREHLAKVGSLDAAHVDSVRRLAAQLQELDVLPVLGAGASYDCGMRLASEIGSDLYDDYMADSSFAPHAVALQPNLGEVAQAIFNKLDQKAVVKAVGLHDQTLWPYAEDISKHFCVYCILARLAREDMIQEAIAFNYDCAAEAGLLGEGFLASTSTTLGRGWPDHATVVADAATHSRLARPGTFRLFKAHGCAARYREVARTDEDRAADDIIIRKAQLTNWRDDTWARDVLRDRSRNHVLLLIGFSGQDPVIQGELNTLLDEVYSDSPPDGVPRVVAVDYEPGTADLAGLVKTGLGGKSGAPDVVTQVSTKDGTTTATLLLLLTEWLAVRLSDPFAHHGVALPSEVDSRVAAIAISAPIMLRWSYLLSAPAVNQFIQRSNIQQAAERGYVPLTADPDTTARALRDRDELRRRLGKTDPESTEDASADHGFVVSGGCAFLPVGRSFDELLAGCRPGAQIDLVRQTLGHPTHLDCVVVSDGDGGLRGINIATGREVAVP